MVNTQKENNLKVLNTTSALLDIIIPIQCFYLYELLSLLPIDIRRHSHLRFNTDLKDSKITYEKNFARALRDVLTCISIGEARHGRAQSFHPVHKFINCGKYLNNHSYSNRRVIYMGAYRFNPEKVAPQLVEIFSDARWKKGYGGKKWMRIISLTSMYGKVPNSTFIDSVLNLYHNGSICFDKDVIFNVAHKNKTLGFLTARKNGLSLETPLVATSKNGILPIDRKMRQFLHRASILNISNVNFTEIKIPVVDLDFQFLEWGDSDLGKIKVMKEWVPVPPPIKYENY